MAQVSPGAFMDGRSGLNPGDFITPNDPAVQAVAREIVAKLGENDSQASRLREAYNYVTASIQYVMDTRAFGFEEVWQKPSSTLQRRIGDCEDTSFLLCSLLQALGIPSRVVFGEWKGQGHAWVEAGVDGAGSGILESTTGLPFAGFADPAGYTSEGDVGSNPLEDPLIAMLVYVSPGLAMFAAGAFLMLDDAHDAFKMDLSESTTEGHPGKHGVLTGLTFPGLGPHLHHWWLGFLLVILGLILIAVGVILWMLKYL